MKSIEPAKRTIKVKAVSMKIFNIAYGVLKNKSSKIKEKTMNTKKISMIVVCLLVFVFSLNAKAQNSGPSVEEIYDSIRYSGPQYDWQESIVTFTNQGMTLVCSLTIPGTPHLPPIVITLNGFMGTRDEAPVTGTEEGILKRNARLLAEQGIASLRVDFRGSGDSDGEHQMISFSTQVSDALAALDYIENNLEHQVNIKSIGILGFSQGGLVGSTAAAKDKRVDSLVLWSPATAPAHTYEGLITKPRHTGRLSPPGWRLGHVPTLFKWYIPWTGRSPGKGVLSRPLQYRSPG